MKRIATVVLLVSFLSAAYAQISNVQERVQIDPAVQGLWYVAVSSEDGGKTVTDVDEIMCRVHGSRIVLANGEVMHVSTVIAFTENGIVYNSVRFSGLDVLWVISKPNPPSILVQIFGPDNKEKMRFIALQK